MSPFFTRNRFFFNVNKCLLPINFFSLTSSYKRTCLIYCGWKWLKAKKVDLLDHRAQKLFQYPPWLVWWSPRNNFSMSLKWHLHGEHENHAKDVNDPPLVARIPSSPTHPKILDWWFLRKYFSLKLKHLDKKVWQMTNERFFLNGWHWWHVKFGCKNIDFWSGKSSHNKHTKLCDKG